MSQANLHRFKNWLMLSLILVLVSSFLIPAAHSASPLSASLPSTDSPKSKQQCPAPRNSTMNLLQKDDALDLSKLRDVLIRLEDTIIFALIERAQFALNDCTYQPGVYKYDNDFKGSFLEYFLHEMEQVHARVRRYTSPDEYPFTKPLPKPILTTLDFPPILHNNSVNVNDKIMKRYLADIVPNICSPGDDLNYGSSATRDVECLQALSKRIHYGKFIAESKFMDPKNQKTYIELIKSGNRTGIMELLTNKAVEDALLKRLRRKAMIYGSDITDNVSEDHLAGHNGTSLCIDDKGNGTARKIRADVVVDLYERFVIPLTKDVEVEYLMQRLDGWQASKDV